MSYRYYGGTRETSIERDMADLKWMEKHGTKRGWKALQRGNSAINAITVIICGLFVFGVIALVIWGIQNLVTSGISWQLILFNPITFIVLLVGWGWSKCRY